MNARLPALLFVLTFLLSSTLPAGPKVVFVLGEKEYKTLDTVPAFFESDLKPSGFEATFITAPPEGEKRDDFSGLSEALKDADLVFVSVRRRAPAAKDMQALKKFVADGGPLVAIRTSSHAFHLRGKPAPEGRELWEEFDPEILGGNYHGHYGNEMATLTIVPEVEDHPIFEGVSQLPKSDKLYQAKPLAPSAVLLVSGTIEGKDAEPMAWTNTVGENRARIFYTSMGQDTDFADPEFRKFLHNAILWAVSEKR